jgi:membrane protein implicated in regulation of membrane protease activity
VKNTNERKEKNRMNGNNFGRILLRNGRRILLGIVGLVLAALALYGVANFFIAVGTVVKIAVEFIYGLAMENKWVAVLILAIIGCSIMELLDYRHVWRRFKLRHKDVSEESKKEVTALEPIGNTVALMSGKSGKKREIEGSTANPNVRRRRSDRQTKEKLRLKNPPMTHKSDLKEDMKVGL